MIKVGILAFQGDIEEHYAAVLSLGVKCVRVREEKDFTNLTHLILPGGESTTIGKFLKSTGIGAVIKEKVKNNSLKVYGTCAGAILLAKNIETKVPVHNLGLIDVTISRNAYGSQIDSFSTKIEFIPLQQTLQAIFIRAPKILQCGENVQVLAKQKKDIVAVQEGNVLLSTFHPELVRPAYLHEYFIKKF